MKKSVKKATPAKASKNPVYSSYTDIKTVEDAFAVMGYKMSQRPIVKNCPPHLQPVSLGDFDLLVVHEAVCKLTRFKPDPANAEQKKWWTWRYVTRVKKSKKHPAGLGFSDTRTYCDLSITGVGPRLCTGDPDSARYIATQFEHLYIARWF